MTKTCWLTTALAFAVHLPRPGATGALDAIDDLDETTCTTRGDGETAVAWAIRDEHTGLTWWFERRDREGRRIGRPVELGWGYDGAETCALGYHAGRYLATWAWWDPYGSKPELRTAVIADDRRIGEDGRYLGPHFELEPVRVSPTRRGWTIDYRHAPDGELHRIDVDRDGRLRP